MSPGKSPALAPTNGAKASTVTKRAGATSPTHPRRSPR
jgi:hypothetical protein